MEYVQSFGEIVYEPNRTDSFKRNNSWWVVVNVDIGIVLFYNYMIRKNKINPLGIKDHPLKLQYPKWGPHITVLDGRSEVPEEYRHNWKMHDGERISFYYSPYVKKFHNFWYLPVYSEFLTQLRKDLGLNPNYNFHITVGRETIVK